MCDGHSVPGWQEPYRAQFQRLDLGVILDHRRDAQDGLLQGREVHPGASGPAVQQWGGPQRADHLAGVAVAEGGDTVGDVGHEVGVVPGEAEGDHGAEDRVGADGEERVRAGTRSAVVHGDSVRGEQLRGDLVVPTYTFPEAAATSLGHAAAYQAWRSTPAGGVPDLTGVDLAALEETVLRISAMVEDHPEIEALELCPVRLLPPGDGVAVGHATIRLADNTASGGSS